VSEIKLSPAALSSEEAIIGPFGQPVRLVVSHPLSPPPTAAG